MKDSISDVLFSFALVDGEIDVANLISGKLYISDLEGIYIEYSSVPSASSFKNSISQSSTSFIVYGQIVGGERFTAHECYRGKSKTNFSNGGLSTSTASIQVSILFGGSWIKNTNTINIDGGKVRFSYLEHWLNSFEIEDESNDNKTISFTVPLKQFSSSLDVQIDDDLSITVSRNWERRVKLNRKLSFEVKQYLEYDFANSVPLKSYYRINATMQNFFRLILPSKNIFIEEEFIKIDDKNIQMYISNKHYIPESDNISSHDFLYLYNEETINVVLRNWFNAQKSYGRVFGVLSSILDTGPFMYLEHNFLNLIQWYEGYCRLKYPTSNEYVQEFKQRISDILNQIEKDEDKQLISEITQYSSEPPLKNQLKKLFDSIELKKIIDGNSKTQKGLIYSITAYRNMLTHPNKDNLLSLQQLAYLTNVLKDCIFVVLIKVLELDENKRAIQGIMENIQFNYLKFIEAKREEDNDHL